MKQMRGITQVLFGFLPQQTVDLENRVWKVSRWNQTTALPIDSQALRHALGRAAAPWTAAGKDGGIAEELAKAVVPRVFQLDRGVGSVVVERFPRLYRCRKAECRRVTDDDTARCRCGNDSWVQLPFVAFHECGALDTPLVPRCPAHHESAMSATSSSRVSEIEFHCPVCKRRLGKGMVPRWCRCAAGVARDDEKGRMHVNVHRAGQVFSPRHTVIVNPADPAATRRLEASPLLEWALDGFAQQGPSAGKKTWESVVVEIEASGFSREFAEQMANAAVAAGEAVRSGGDPMRLAREVREGATQEALSLAATLELGQCTLADMASQADAGQRTLYETAYPDGLRRARLAEVRLLTKFPVATVAYGYTRGEFGAGESELIGFRDTARRRVAYGTLAHTEGLMFLLKPTAVHAHLAARGLIEGRPRDAREARRLLLEGVTVPEPHEADKGTPGDGLFRLIHSYAHRAMRHLAPHCGVERDGLAEYLLPHHLGFIIYAAGRGEFVMGGLQATFERSLARFLHDLVDAEHRCPMDPRCGDDAAACAACLHVGEPSCRAYNRRLSRKELFGTNGYLTKS